MRQTTNAQQANVLSIENRSAEVADILREHIAEYQETYPLLPEQYKIVHNLLSCRTAVLGGHVEKCDHCGTERIFYNSCRNRHCPKCQHMPRERWLEERKAELLPISYFHNVFTLPHDLNPIVLFNKKIMLNILFKTVSETLLAFGENPKNKLSGKLGFRQLDKNNHPKHSVSLPPRPSVLPESTSQVKYFSARITITG